MSLKRYAAIGLLTFGLLLGGVGSVYYFSGLPSVVQEKLPPFLQRSDSSVAGEEVYTLASVGDIMAARPFSHYQDRSFDSLAGLLRQSDVTIGNFEQTAIDLRTTDGHPSVNPEGTWFVGEPAVPKDLHKLGFDMVTRANNHAYDMGIEGMKETSDRLEQAGIRHAGTGSDLSSARAVRYFRSPDGRRVALVSITSSFIRESQARKYPGKPGNYFKKPGVNPLRVKKKVLIKEEEMNSLRNIRNGYSRIHAAESRYDTALEQLGLFGTKFKIGQKRGFEYSFKRRDLREFLRSIRRARLESDYVVASIHSHQPGNWSKVPADFLKEVARQSIDAGADVVMGHGPHRLRGIEIHEGKPIFYSLGNFVFQFEQFKPELRVREDLTYSYLEKLGNIKLPERTYEKLDIDSGWYESVVAVSFFEDGTLSRVKLYPVRLNYRTNGPERGIPRIAEPAEARRILKRLRRLSSDYGTSLKIGDRFGVITPPE